MACSVRLWGLRKYILHLVLTRAAYIVAHDSCFSSPLPLFFWALCPVRMAPSLRRTVGASVAAETELDQLVEAARSVPNSPLRPKRAERADRLSTTRRPAIRTELIPTLRK